MAVPPSEPNGTLRFQVAAMERRLDRLEAFEPAVMRAEVLQFSKEISLLNAKIDAQAETSNRKMQSVSNRLLGLALAIASGAVLYALTATSLAH